MTVLGRALIAAGVALTVAAGLGPMPPAHASREQISILDVTKEATGFYGGRRVKAAVADADRLGVDVLRVLIYWPDAAPSVPGGKPPEFNPRKPADYGGIWGAIDQTIYEATARGIKVMLVPTGRFPNGAIPRWASRHPFTSNEPKPRHYEDFVHAIGSRYNGRFDPDGEGPNAPLPAAAMFAVWNEPNSETFLRPQRVRGGLYSPLLYRRLVAAARRGLDSAGWGGTLLAGETSPGFTGTRAIEFMREVLCLDTGPCAPNVNGMIDGWSHHPYGFGVVPWKATTDEDAISIGNLNKLTDALPPGMPLYITEFGYESVPDPNGLPELDHAEYLSIAEQVAWGNPRVASFAQYLLRDDPPVGSTFESGLRRFAGQGRTCELPRLDCKPAWYAFRTPLTSLVVGDQAVIWGHLRPAEGQTIAYVNFVDPDGRVGLAEQVITDPSGYFVFVDYALPGRRWWIQWGTHAGPKIRGYAFP